MCSHYLLIIILLLLNIAQLNKQILSILELSNLKINIQENQTIKQSSEEKLNRMGDKIIEIDGSILEGGGQIIRVALCLSALTRKPIRVINIRAGRDKPGLMEQHLKGLELLQAITAADVRGAIKGSTMVEFHPGVLQFGHFKSIVKTAGSISLVLQVALPCCIFAPKSINLKLEGGTNADMAPQIDYITEVFRPNLEKMGATFDFDLIKRGYFPRGGGSVEVSIQPIKELQPIVLEHFGEITAIYGWSFSAGRSTITEAEDIAKAAQESLKQFKINVEIDVYHEDKKIAPIGDCAGIILVAETSTGCVLGSSSLKKRNENPSETGQRAGDELSDPLQRKVCVDEYTQDQLIIFMALANGKSRIKVHNVTMHTKTAIYITELLTKAKFKIQDFSDHTMIECEGIGYQQQTLA